VTQKRYRDPDKLRDAVRVKCLEEFEEFAGKPWDPVFEKWATPPAAVERETEAIAVLAKLRKAMRDAVKFSTEAGSSPGYECSTFLAWWAPQCVAPLLQHAYLKERKEPVWRIGRPDIKPPTPEWSWHITNKRSWLVEVWDRHWKRCGMPKRLEARQYAVVSLLAGNYPRLDLGTKRGAGMSVAHVIERETKAMRIQMDRRVKSKERKQSG
jgi:hypothetical protein